MISASGLIGSMLQPVNRDGDDNDPARDDLLPAGFEPELGAAVAQDGHDQRADERAEDAALSAGKARAADDDGGDDVQLIAHGGGGIALADVGELQHSSDAGEDGARDIDEDFGAVDGDAAEPGSV